jgi:hypothetical protein
MADSDSNATTPNSTGSDSKAKRALKAAGRSLMSSGASEMSDSGRDASSSIHAVSYKRGGKTRKDAPANLHKNERVIPANKRKKVEKMMKRAKMTLTNRKGKKRSSKRSERG